MMNLAENKSREITLMKVKKTGIAGFFQEIFQHRVMYLMVVPTIVFFLLFAYIPIIGIYYAFTNFNFIGGLFGSPFVGLANFKYLFMGGLGAPVFGLTIRTILYNLAFIFIANGLECVLAVFLVELPSKLFKRLSQSIILLPYFISFVIIGTIAYNIFNYEIGAFNNLLESLGWQPVNVYAMPHVWPPLLVVFYLWKNVGYGTVIYLAAIMGLDHDIYESARIDGCNVIQEVRYLTIPLLKPTFIMLVLFGLGNIMRGQFELFYQLIGRNGQLFVTTDVIDTYVYRMLTLNFNIGFGTAAGVYQSIFGLFVVLVVNGIIRRVNPENALF
jgi:putative aldouronate transport system permease protein